MKKFKFVLVVFIMMLLSTGVRASDPPVQGGATTTTQQATPQVASTGSSTGTAPEKKPETAASTPCDKCVLQDSNKTIVVISYAPLVLFLFVVLLVFLKLKKEDYKIGDALKENETISVTNNTTVPPTTDQIQPKSCSRLIAFLTGLVTLGIASTFCSFWLFMYFKCGTPPKLEDISNVLLSLGLGVIPYAVNKVSNAIK